MLIYLKPIATRNIAKACSLRTPSTASIERHLFQDLLDSFSSACQCVRIGGDYGNRAVGRYGFPDEAIGPRMCGAGAVLDENEDAVVRFELHEWLRLAGKG